MWGALSDERTGLSFTIAVVPRQRSHSLGRIPRNSDHILLSQIPDHSQPGGPGPRIYIPQKKDGPIILPGTEFLFRLLLRLAASTRGKRLRTGRMLSWTHPIIWAICHIRIVSDTGSVSVIRCKGSSDRD
jgi:hypothetical protein